MIFGKLKKMVFHSYLKIARPFELHFEGCRIQWQAFEILRCLRILFFRPTQQTRYLSFTSHICRDTLIDSFVPFFIRSNQEFRLLISHNPIIIYQFAIMIPLNARFRAPSCVTRQPHIKAECFSYRWKPIMNHGRRCYGNIERLREKNEMSKNKML